ncbi:kinase-like protein [Gigaspora margarita]|uniref:Kinase-like protein n=1 Tax=Gigaspora margarita TaxID=4874 RepID=A0A8H3X5Y0_GIGMA|nr:kinase-like protein [Gigaspora margarita]
MDSMTNRPTVNDIMIKLGDWIDKIDISDENEIKRQFLEADKVIKQDLQSGNAQQDLQSGNVQQDLQSGNVQQDLQSGNVQQDLQSGNVQQDFQSGNVQQDLQSGNVQQDLHSENVQKYLQSGYRYVQQHSDHMYISEFINIREISIRHSRPNIKSFKKGVSLKEVWEEWLEKAIDDEYINEFDYNKFTNLEEICKGGFGTVHKCLWEECKLTIALKGLNNIEKGDEKSDIYSLGVILWEITSGKPPFKSFKTPEQIAINIYQGKREAPVKDTPEEYVALYKRCWSEDPEKRPDAKTLHDILECFISGNELTDLQKQAIQSIEKKTEFLNVPST